MLEKFVKRLQRQKRIRAKISWTSSRPRLSIYRSNVNIYAQLIDDVTGTTLCSFNDIKIEKWTKTERASQVWENLAKKALSLNISEVVFDRWGFAYQGRVEALANAARSAWLKF